MPDDERIIMKDSAGDSLLNASSSTHNLPLVAGGLMPGASSAAVNDVERAMWQQEKEKLYQLLDDKVYRGCCVITDSFVHSRCNGLVICLYIVVPYCATTATSLTRLTAVLQDNLR